MGKRNIDPAVKETYIEWLLQPEGNREPATKEAMAELLGVHVRTLYNWEESDEVQAKLREVKTRWGVRYQPTILRRLMAIVEEGKDSDSISAARVLLSHLDVRTEEEKSKMSNDRVEEIKRDLERLGFKTIDNDA